MLVAAGHRSATLRTRPGSPTEEHYRRDGWTGDGIDQAGLLILRKRLVGRPLNLPKPPIVIPGARP